MTENFIPVPSATAGYNVRTQEIVKSSTTVQVHYMIPAEEDGTAVIPGEVFNLDVGGGTENVVGVSLRKTGDGGSVELGTEADPVWTETPAAVAAIEAFNAPDQDAQSRFVGIAGCNPSGLIGVVNAVGAGPTNADGEATVTTNRHLQVKDRLYGFNGTTWDRLRSDTTYGLDVDVTRSALPTGAATETTLAALNAKTDEKLTLRLDEVSAAVSYLGEAALGSAGSSAVWRIKKLSTSGTVLSILWCDGDSSFNNVWDDRASLSYS